MSINWLKEKQIKAAANAGKLEALECSLEHWMQMTTATAEELRKAADQERVSDGTTHCALCVKYYKVDKGCPLSDLVGMCYGACCTEWMVAEKKDYTRLDSYNSADHTIFRKAATPLKKRLRAEIRKAKKEKK